MAKLQGDYDHRLSVANKACPWQRFKAPEPRGESSVERLEVDVATRPLHASATPLLEQVLSRLGSTRAAAEAAVAQTDRLGNPRIDSFGQTDVLLVRCPPGSEEERQRESDRGSACSHEASFVLKMGGKDRIFAEVDKLHWAASVLGASRVPRLLLAVPEAWLGQAAMVSERITFVPDSDRRSAARLPSSLADLLLLGCGRFALEDVRASWAAAPVELQAALPFAVNFDVPPPSATDVRCVARQVAEILATLARHPVQPNSHEQLDPALIEGKAIILNLLQPLRRHLLQAQPARASPLHATMRQRTEEWYPAFADGASLSDMLGMARRLKDRLEDWRSADNRGCSQMPKFFVPAAWTHGRMSAHHLLLRSSSEGSDRNLDLCVIGWSSLSQAPLYTDLAGLLTSVAFETTRLPVMLDVIASSYASSTMAGDAVPALRCARQLCIEEASAERLLKALAVAAEEAVVAGADVERQDRWRREEALLSAVHSATGGEALQDAGQDTAWLLAWLRTTDDAGRRAAVEAGHASRALVDWRPFRGIRGTVGGRPAVPRPDPSAARRQRGEAPVRAVQFGWQTIREFRDAACAALPALEGDVDALWPAIWFVPCLSRALELLDDDTLPWLQKVWLLSFVGQLVERILEFLDQLPLAKDPLCVRIAVAAAT
eukprot:CAMPEP_0177528642 /NCGR_PEP_ID=MMETSP0369-20130122/52348_1 /TAXON_ID=447022 ORGANISM="Scrippsiella hangoei-like, Strain SHHI-4" /NCGR_SAMPLE_ID=MMETSP0369 /ASSEMBLY_ACC=CAM_ASM_000364 /LENGTH=661 /DNA_ID=CAMNT_0019009191 /DNA_START=38 /DNA_END=2023 /DNA_ORIENTATION=-